MQLSDAVVGGLFVAGTVGLIVAYGFLRRRDAQREMEQRRLNPGGFPPVAEPFVLTDVHIPFLRLVAILVKIALASIPAMLIVTVVVGFVWAVIIAGMMGGR